MGKGIQELTIFLKDIKSAWRGHADFAVWLVKELKPSVIVDLGVEFGFSTFVFASPKIGKVYGIDWFKGDSFTKEPNTRKEFMASWKILKKLGLDNIEIIEDRFSSVAKRWKLPIDILNIDGSHRYEDVKEDFEDWSKFVKDGVVLFHDIYVPNKKYEGVNRFFREIDLPKTMFFNSFGLGIVSKDKSIIEKINKKWGDV